MRVSGRKKPMMTRYPMNATSLGVLELQSGPQLRPDTCRTYLPQPTTGGPATSTAYTHIRTMITTFCARVTTLTLTCSVLNRLYVTMLVETCVPITAKPVIPFSAAGQLHCKGSLQNTTSNFSDVTTKLSKHVRDQFASGHPLLDSRVTDQVASEAVFWAKTGVARAL